MGAICRSFCYAWKQLFTTYLLVPLKGEMIVLNTEEKRFQELQENKEEQLQKTHRI